MWTYERALSIAKELKQNIDYCVEFENAYMFAAYSEQYNIGGDGPVFIMKETGSVLPPTEFYDTAATAIVRDEFSI